MGDVLSRGDVHVAIRYTEKIIWNLKITFITVNILLKFVEQQLLS